MVSNLTKYQDLNKTFMTWLKRQNYIINILFWSSSKLFGSIQKLDWSKTILDLRIEENWLGLLVLKVGGDRSVIMPREIPRLLHDFRKLFFLSNVKVYKQGLVSSVNK